MNRRLSQQSMAFYRVSRCLVHKQWSRILVLHFTYISSVLASTCAPFSRNHSPNLYFERVISCSENEASVGVTNRDLLACNLFKTLNDKIIKVSLVLLYNNPCFLKYLTRQCHKRQLVALFTEDRKNVKILFKKLTLFLYDKTPYYLVPMFH